MKRRTLFRKGMDSYVGKLKKIIDTEKDRRNNFINTQVQYLPSHFWPQLKELPGHLTYDGSPKDLEFPDFKANYEIKCDENIFDSMGGSAATGNHN